jgi:UDP-GlcNAc:undecaprenyl-phosphate GlcNAc-1-phosphate transferase
MRRARCTPSFHEARTMNLHLVALAEPNDPFAGLRFPLVAMLVSMAATLLATPWVRRLAIAKGAVDDPSRDDRRVHSEPIPRWGGLAIFVGILASVVAVLPFAYPMKPFPTYLVGLVVAGAVLVAVGTYDDVRPLSARIQTLVLLAVGVGVQFVFDPVGRVQVAGINVPSDAGQVWVPFGLAAVPLTAAYLFVVTKTMDTIDGIDGLAAGIAAIAGCTLAIIAVYEGQPRVALLCAAVAGSAIGFLRYNYNPAKIFMGTGGAQVLGFMLASLSVVGALKTAAALALFIPILVFGVPILDAAVVVVRRLLGGHPVTQADTRHIHHELLGRGLSQRQAVWVLYLLAMALGGLLIHVVRSRG